MTDSRDKVYNSTELSYLTFSDQLNHIFRNSKPIDIGEIRTLFERLRAARNQGVSGQAQTSPSSTSIFLENVTKRSFPVKSDVALTTFTPISAVSTDSNTIRKTMPGIIDSQDGMKSITAGNLWSNYSDITTESNVLVTKRPSLDQISAESKTSDGVFIADNYSAETIGNINRTSSPRTHSSPRLSGSSFFDQAHLNSLMEKLSRSNIEIEPIRTIVDESVLERSATLVNEEDFWHSYTYNTGVFNRESK